MEELTGKEPKAFESVMWWSQIFWKSWLSIETKNCSSLIFWGLWAKDPNPNPWPLVNTKYHRHVSYIVEMDEIT
jgi:hypothetical protein